MNDATPAFCSALATSLPTGITPLTAADAQVAPYADDYYAYDGQGRISSLTAQGRGCSSCSGGLGTSTFSYAESSGSIGQNAWASKTIEILPDGTVQTDYYNAFGQQMDAGKEKRSRVLLLTFVCNCLSSATNQLFKLRL